MKTLCIICVLIAILLPASGLAQKYHYKLDGLTSSGPRYVGDQDVGDVSFTGFDLYVSQMKLRPSHRSGAPIDTTWSHLTGIEFRQFYNDIDETSTLVLPETEFNFGLQLQAKQHCSFGVAGTQKTFLNDNPYSSSLFHMKYQRDHGGLELGLQPSSDGSLTYLMGDHDFDTTHRFYYSLSRETVETGNGPSINEKTYNRFGGGLRYQLPIDRLHLLFGAGYNPTLEKPSWVFGLSRSIDFGSQGWNPGLMAVHRIKPGSQYTLAILTFGGHALNQHANVGMHEAFYQGLQQTSKIVGGKHMGRTGIGNQYEQRDFGTISLAWSRLMIDISDDVALMQNDFTGYATWPGQVGPIFRPYFGLTVAKFSDLIYDPMLHNLTDPEQDYVEFMLGGKIQLSQQYDKEQGCLRVNLYFRDTGQLGLKTSFWF